MMRSDQTALHRVYPVERHGDTVVLRPRGDAVGFSLSAVSNEMARVRELVQTGDAKHLLIDLGNDRYFGSMVIGDLVELGQLVRDRGGRTGVCDVSPDMVQVLQLMNLDDQWEQFPTRAAALHALATVSMQERMRPLRRAAPWIAAIAVMFAVYWWFPRPNYGRIYHEKLSALWRETAAKRSQAGVEEWERVLKRNKTQLEPIVAQLNDRIRQGRATDGEKFLLYAAREHWMRGLSNEGPLPEYDRQMVQFYLDKADAEMKHGPSPPPPVYPHRVEIAAENLSDTAGQAQAHGEWSTVAIPRDEGESSVLPVSASVLDNSPE